MSRLIEIRAWSLAVALLAAGAIGGGACAAASLLTRGRQQ